jgi:hypothetical protein
MRLPCCLYVCESSSINFRMPEPTFMKLCVYDHGAWAHLNGVLRKSLPSIYVSLYVSHYLCYATVRWKRYRGNEYTHNTRRIVGRVVFSTVRVL